MVPFLEDPVGWTTAIRPDSSAHALIFHMLLLKTSELTAVWDWSTWEFYLLAHTEAGQAVTTQILQVRLPVTI